MLIRMMMEKENFDQDVSVGEIMERWPQTLPVFVKFKMGCVGCSMSKFETLRDAIEIYQTPKAEFLQELEQVIKKGLP